MQDDGLATWDGGLYAANTGHHRAFDQWFLSELPLAPGDRVLDLGCGAGDFTRTVADLVGADGAVVGLDAQPSMVEEAQARAGANQSFVVGRAQDVASLVEGPFDLAFSRAVLHWVPEADHLGVLRSVAGLVKPGGWVRLEFGGGDNIPESLPTLNRLSAEFGGPQTPWTFLGVGRYLALVEQAGLTIEGGGHVRLVPQRRPFDAAGVVGWLQSQCLAAYETGIDPDRHEAFRAAAVAAIDDMRHWDDTYDQTFVRLDVLARRPA